MRDRIHVLWRHYSSWALYAIGALAAAQADPAIAPYLTLLPKWVMVVLVIIALAAKVIPQKPPAPKPIATPYQDEGPGS